ncbi:MAG: hypothetical protein U0Z26_08640 [Anaerolineales bacterium]
MNQITLLIVDDHPLFRQGVVDALSLEPDMRIIAQSATGDEALELILHKEANNCSSGCEFTWH